MVTKIEAYRCSVCNGTVEGTLEEAVAHENIPVSKRIPKGLLVVSCIDDGKDGLFYLIADEGILQRDHKFHHNQFGLFYTYEKGIEVYGNNPMPTDYDSLTKLINKGNIRTLSPKELEDFKIKYQQEMQFLRVDIGLKPEEIISNIELP